MKKILLSVAALSLLIGATVFTSCKKTDNTAPTITVKPANPYTVHLGATYTDPGATAVDNSGNDITSSIVNNITTTNPNMAAAGTYTIDYNVSDANGNAATQETRTVYVAVFPANLAGTWHVSDATDTTVTYTDILTASTVTPLTTVWTGNFGAYSGAIIYFTLSGVDGRTITVPQQQIACGSDGDTRSFTGSGTVSADGATITINYTVTDITAATSPTTGTDTYTNKSKK